MKISARELILEAYEKGYRVTEDGVLIGSYGRPLALKIWTGQLYPMFSIVSSSTHKRHSILTHRMAAFCFYGEKMFDYDCVRHLDGDPLNIAKSNIICGSDSDNEQDKGFEIRSLAAQKRALKLRGRPGARAQLSDSQVRIVREYLATGLDGAEIERITGISRNTVYRIKKGKFYTYVK